MVEELCCEMGLQQPEALDEYILFVVTNRGEGSVRAGWLRRAQVAHAAGTLRLPGWHRAERAAADPTGIPPGRGCGDRAQGPQLHLLVPPRGLEPAPQV